MDVDDVGCWVVVEDCVVFGECELLCGFFCWLLVGVVCVVFDVVDCVVV